jgi:hypothetical protein
VVARMSVLDEDFWLPLPPAAGPAGPEPPQPVMRIATATRAGYFGLVRLSGDCALAGLAGQVRRAVVS